MPKDSKRTVPPTGSVEIASLPKAVPTENVPIVYANVASIVSSHVDFKIYLMDASPKEVAVHRPLEHISTTVAPRLCIVVAPEFARSLRDALDTTLTKYEAQFGKLRPPVTVEILAGPPPKHQLKQ